MTPPDVPVDMDNTEEKPSKDPLKVAGWGLVVLLACLTVLALCSAYFALVTAGLLPGRFPLSIKASGSTAHSLPAHLIGRTLQITTSYVSFGQMMPWTKHPYSHAPATYGAPGMVGCGVVVDRAKKLILTGDFVARDVSELLVFSMSDTKRFDAEVLLMAEDVHLAILRVNDDAFWNSYGGEMPVLEFSRDLPSVSTPVQISGYFSGESAVAVQTGLVSQLQFGVHGGHLVHLGRSQGTSGFYAKIPPEPDGQFNGGPVFSLTDPDGPALGFMALAVGKGYFVPGPVVHRMLNEYYHKGSWGGLVSLSVLFRDLQAEPMRDFWRLDEGGGSKGHVGRGVMIRAVAPSSNLAGAGVGKGDVLVSIDGRPVHEDGTISIPVGGQDFNFPVSAALSGKGVGDIVKLQLLRPNAAAPEDGASMPPKLFKVDITLGTSDPLIRRLSGKGAKPGLGKAPSYFSVGGLIFSVLTQDLLEEIGMQRNDLGIPSETLVQVLRRWRADPTEEIVVFLRGLEDKCNGHYNLDTVRVLTHFNSKPVHNLEGLLLHVGAVVTAAQRKQETNSGTGCEGDGDFLEFTFLPDANKDAAGDPGVDPDMVLLASCVYENSRTGMMRWLSMYGALPFSLDLMKTYSEEMLQGKSIQELLGEQKQGNALIGLDKNVASLLQKASLASVSQGSLTPADFMQLVAGTETRVKVPRFTADVPKPFPNPQLASIAGSQGVLSGWGQQRGYGLSPSRSAPLEEEAVPTVSEGRVGGFLENAGSDLDSANLPTHSSLLQDAMKRVQERARQEIDSLIPNEAPSLTGIARHSEGGSNTKSSSTAAGMTGGVPIQLHESPSSTSSVHLPMNNVVKISSVNREPSYTSPWIPSGQFGARCSGIILDVKRRFILTCAHCVASSEMLYISREDFPKSTLARVVEIAHDMDLAWMTADNSEGFWDNIEVQHEAITPQMPSYGSEVQVVGYPIGGSTITQTKGVVSRVDGQVYPNGLEEGFRNAPSSLLVFQVDAAINPGNSGGPAFNDKGELLGLAFAGLDSAQNVGYVIPNAVIQNFVNAVVHEGQQWIAQTELGIRAASMQNPSMRAYWGLGADDHGVQLRTIAPIAPLEKAGVRKTDLLTSVDGLNVTDTGQVSYPGGGDHFLVDLDVVISQKQRYLPKGEAPLMDQQAIGESEMKGHPKNAGEYGKGGTSPKSHGKKDKPEWSHPDQMQYPTTNLVFLRRVCDKKGATMKSVPVSLKLAPIPPLVPRFDDAAVGLYEDVIGRRKAVEMGFATTPRYFEIGGLVWSVLSMPLLNDLKGSGQLFPHATSLCMHRWKLGKGHDNEDQKTKALGGCGTETKEVVILLRGLDHPVNKHYGKSLVRVLRYFNGEQVVSLKGLIKQVGRAFHKEAKFLSFTFEPLEDGNDLAGDINDPDIVLNARDVLKAEFTGEILMQHGLQNPVSGDLIETYREAMLGKQQAEQSFDANGSPNATGAVAPNGTVAVGDDLPTPEVGPEDVMGQHK